MSGSGRLSRICTVLTTEDDVSALEDKAEDRDVASDKDEGNNASIRDTSCAGVLPAEDVVEQGVVVYRPISIIRRKAEQQTYA